jgi:hypothetical protein
VQLDQRVFFLRHRLFDDFAREGNRPVGIDAFMRESAYGQQIALFFSPGRSISVDSIFAA